MLLMSFIKSNSGFIKYAHIRMFNSIKFNQMQLYIIAYKLIYIYIYYITSELVIVILFF